MFKRIVVGTDGSGRARQAVAVAAQLARDHGAELHLVQAYRPAAALVATMAAPEAAAAGFVSDGEVAQQIETHLGALKAELDRDLDVHTHASPQAPSQAILSLAENIEADLVVVGSKGMQGARRVLGSVPNSVAHQATCAVLIVPTEG
jgi:nucleotide-binding universal stress UspA family protein